MSRQRHDRIALFGDFVLAMEVADELSARKHDLVYVAPDDDTAERATERGVDTVSIDYTDDTALRSIGIGGDIDTIFCLFLDDSSNVFLTISARAIDANLVIVSLTSSRESEQKLQAAGANKTVDPFRLSGRKIFELITRPAVIDLLDRAVFGKQDLNVAELTVPEGSFLDGVALSSVSFVGKYNLVLLGVVDQESGSELIFRSQGIEHSVDAADVLVVIGPRAEVDKLRTDLDRRS